MLVESWKRVRLQSSGTCFTSDLSLAAEALRSRIRQTTLITGQNTRLQKRTLPKKPTRKVPSSALSALVLATTKNTAVHNIPGMIGGTRTLSPPK